MPTTSCLPIQGADPVRDTPSVIFNFRDKLLFDFHTTFLWLNRCSSLSNIICTFCQQAFEKKQTNDLISWSPVRITNRIQPTVFHQAVARGYFVFDAIFRNHITVKHFNFTRRSFFLSCSRIKATLTSHMDFRKYPMDVQTLRLQIGACKYKVITDIFD